MSLMGSPQWAYASGDFTIDQSLRFNDDTSAYLSRTPASASNQRTFTFSAWVKRGNIGTEQHIFDGSTGGDSFYIRFNSDSTLQIRDHAESGFYFLSNAVYRDCSAWYHFVLAVDTTQSTQSNRVKFYVNGEQVTSWSASTYPSQNDDTGVNGTTEHRIGIDVSGGKFDGYMAEVHHIDGTALTPASFGETDDDYGHWKPKRVSGLTYGTNGFYFSFAGAGIIAATGGTITTDGDYKVHTFTSNGTFEPTSVGVDNYVEYLIIGGGGAGVGGPNWSAPTVGGGAGGGGAGAHRTGVIAVTAQTYAVVVGAGGTGATYAANADGDPGDASSAFGLTADGGDAGGAYGWPVTSYSGSGSGGGGQGKSDNSAHAGGTGGAYGNDGGDGHAGGTAGNPNYGAGGGGGSGGAGADGSGSAGGNGGAGTVSYITGTAVTRAGGGGGSTWNNQGTQGSGGSGGGGAATNSTGGSGTANTGSGGGGAQVAGGNATGGSGGSGVVIVRYKYQ